MSAGVAIAEESRATRGGVVWDYLWSHRPAAPRDDQLLAREEEGPRFRKLMQRVDLLLGGAEGLRSIELGSGRGDVSALLAKRGAEVTLLDRSEAALREARWRFDRLNLDARYTSDDMLGNLASRAGSFDLSLSLGVVEHFVRDDRTRVIEAHRRVLRPGGLAMISVPHAWCVPYRVWKAYLELRGWWPYGMELPYARRELRRRCLEAGFTQVELFSFGFWQSVGDHWIKRLLGRGPDWMSKRSVLDRWFGFGLVAFAWNGDPTGSAAKIAQDSKK